MKIYIGFSKPTTRFPIFGWFIQWVLKRPYDHVYVRFQELQSKQMMVFQASKEMVNLYNYSIFLQSNKTVKEYIIDTDDSRYSDLWLLVVSTLGIPYSLKTDFGILLMKIFPLKSNPFDSPNEEICSELAAKVCAMLGIPVPEEFSSIDPSALDQLLSNNNVPLA